MQAAGDIVHEAFAIGETSGPIAALGLLGIWFGVSVEMGIRRLKMEFISKGVVNMIVKAKTSVAFA